MKNKKNRRRISVLVRCLIIGQHFASKDFFFENFKRFFLGIAIIRKNEAIDEFGKVMDCVGIIQKKTKVSAKMELTVFGWIVECHMRKSQGIII